MNPRIKRAIMAQRRRRSDGTFMDGDSYGVYMEKSGSRGVRTDGTSYPIYPEMKFRDSRGREHYDNGRYAPMGYIGEYPYVPPVYEQPMHKIGFEAPDEWNPGKYSARVDNMPRDEMSHHKGEMSPGYAKYDEDSMTRETAMRWVSGMKNEDGTTGPHYSMEQAKQIMEQYKIDCDEIEFFVTINMIYSDYCKVAKKNNCSTIEFYACMAKAFLEDKDAQPNKLERYYTCIVKH